MADLIALLAGRLAKEKGFSPISTISLPSEITPPVLGFLGAREYWGSIMTLGPAEGDRLASAQIQQIATDFYRFTHSLLPLAGRIHIGLATTRLGSFGLLVFVFRAGCGSNVLAAVRSSKHGSAFRKDYAVCWAADVPAGRVHTHPGFPLTMFPGRRYLERVLVAT
jgi:hypothetical protein